MRRPLESEVESQIRKIVKTAIVEFSDEFSYRHMLQRKDPDGVINSKVNNSFIAALGDEVRFYSALSRSLDSSLGNSIEKMAVEIAQINFHVSQELDGIIYDEQTKEIATLLESYKNSRNPIKPSVDHYIRFHNHSEGDKHTKRHDSDYILKHKKSDSYSLIELKLGGDLDNKKARSEKEALLEQYCLLINKGEAKPENIRIFFATGYNRYGEGKPWTQGRVRQFFADEELLISRSFWDFVADSSHGYEIVMSEYENQAYRIREALLRIKSAYLG
jgi:hypothetical protein